MNLIFNDVNFRANPVLLLRHPDKVLEVLRAEATHGSPMENKAAALRQLIILFDRIPFTKKCCGCSQPATYCTVHGEKLDLWGWCNVCDPFCYGAFPGKLQFIRSFDDAVHHVRSRCKNRKGDLKCLVRKLGEAKGVPKHLTEGRARRYFEQHGYGESLAA